jgi:hypothetical protein
MFSGKLRGTQISVNRFFTLSVLIGFASCKAPLIEPEKSIPAASGFEITYPLNQPQFPGFSGDFTLKKLVDGTAEGKLKLGGLNSGNRYFGKISITSTSNPNLTRDFADLGEIMPGSSTLSKHLQFNYLNQPIPFDSLILLEGVIRILELSPTGGFSKEVLRGDFGSNLILEDEKAIPVSGFTGQAIGGNLIFRQRKNGQFLVSGNLSGLSPTQTLELTYFKGSSGSKFERKEKIGQISADNSFSFPIIIHAKNLADLDTLKGFIGFEIPGHSADSANFVAIANFGGNVASGNKQSYPIYNVADSTIAGTVAFAEFGPVGTALRLIFKAAPGFMTANAYLSIHRGTTLDAADTLLSVKIPPSGEFEIIDLKNENGLPLRFPDLSQWNAHIRIADNDPLGESNLMARADIGANEVLAGDTLMSYLNEQNPSFNIGGMLIFRKRKNGQVISFFQLGSTQSGVENQILIRMGPKPAAIYDTTTSTFRVARFNGINPGLYKGISALMKKNGQPVAWPELMQAKAEDNYLEYSFSDSGDFQVICRGNL